MELAATVALRRLPSGLVFRKCRAVRNGLLRSRVRGRLRDRGVVAMTTPKPASALLRCEHGRTVRESCDECAHPAYDDPCPACGAQAGFGCRGLRSGKPVVMHAARLAAHNAPSEQSS